MRRIVPHTLILSTLSLCALLCACDADPSEATAARELDEIVANLLAAGFPESEIEIDDDGLVVVGGDAIVTLEASRELAGAEALDPNGFRQYRTTNQVSVTVDNICVDDSNMDGNLSTALDRAIEHYNELGLTFTITRVSGTSAGCDEVIDITMKDGTSAKAGFPSGGLPYDSIQMGDDVQPDYGTDAATHLLMHELGHCIGMRHTDYYDRSISCGGDPDNEGGAGVGAHHIPGTPTTASFNNSVMNSCYHANVSGEWHDDDVTALVELYGEFCTRYNGGAILLESAHDRFVTRSGSDVLQNDSFGVNEVFSVMCFGNKVAFAQPSGGNYQFIRARNGSNGYDVDVETVSLFELFNLGSNKKFTAERQADGTWAFLSQHGLYLNARGEGSNWEIVQLNAAVGAWDKFTVY